MSDPTLLFTTDTPFLVSLLGTQRLGLGLYNKPWKFRHCDIFSDGRLVFRTKDSKPSSGKRYIIKTLSVKKKVEVRTLNIDHDAVESNNPEAKPEIGLLVKCTKVHGLETYFRCILSEEHLEPFLNVLKTFNPDQTLHLKAVMQSPNRKSSKPISSITSPLSRYVNVGAKKDQDHKARSMMRRAVTHALDDYIVQDRYDTILSKRGAFRSLPVAFANDMVHGSWWFAIGSLLLFVQSIVVLWNLQSKKIGTDDSELSDGDFQATWILMIFVGLFYWLGSMAFIRAVHEEPPMKPLFTWYHFQSDELLGSWLFFFGTVPILPYCMIYMSKEHNLAIYFAALFLSVVAIAGSLLFVWASYPTDKDYKPVVLPIARYLCCCCCSSEWLVRNFANDWLAACWIIYYGSLFATIATIVLFIYSISELKDLRMFIHGLYFVENFMFTVGAAYFVAGSYPDEADDDSVHGDDEHQIDISDDLSKDQMNEAMLR